MSGRTIGTIAGAVVGGVIGFFAGGQVFSGAYLGAALGSTVGGIAGQLYDTATAPDAVNEQQSLADLSLQTSTLGAVIPQVWGTYGAIAGNVIWATNKIEHEMREEESGGGKGGGPKQITISKTYTISLAIGLADTRITGQMRRLRRAWRDLTLVYDVDQNAALPDGWTFYQGTATQAPDPTIQAAVGVANAVRYPYLAYVVIVDDNLGSSGRTFNYTFELEMEGSKSLASYIQAHCITAGIGPTQLDLAELPSADVDTVLVSIQAVRAQLQQLAQAYRFIVIESGLSLKFREIGSGGIVATIPEADLDVAEDQAAAQGLGLTRVDDIALPTTVDVTYTDPARDYQQNTQKFHLGIASGSLEAPRTVTTPLALAATQAKQVAQELTLEAWLKRETGQTTLSRKYAFLEPGDRVSITARGLTYTLALNQTTYGHPGLLEISGALDAAFVRGAVGALPGIVVPTAQVITPVGDTTPRLLNLPALNSGDQMPRYHVAYIGANEPWEGGTLHRSTDNEATYHQVDAASLEGITGTVAIAMPNVDVHFLDTTSTVQVVLEYGTLSSLSDLALYNGGNLALVGNEIFGFGVATLVGAKTYNLTRLLRGRRGTEWAVSGHSGGENFVLLDAGVRKIAMTLADRNVQRPYKAVTFGQTLADASAVSFTPTADNLNPWTVANVRAERTGNDWAFFWRMRSRFAGDWVDGIGTGFDNDFLAFRVDIFTTSGYSVVIRSTTTDGGSPMDPEAEKTLAYPESQQITDFGSGQATVHYRIYQLANNGISRPENLVAA